jgi:hypothetical protein
VRRQAGAILVCVLALSAVACGSSSNTSAASSAASPTVSRVPTSTGPATTYDPHHVPRSAVIASSAYYNTWLQVLGQQRLSTTRSQFGAHCIQNGLKAAGFKTQGDVEGRNAHQAISIVLACLAKARTK